LPRRSQSNQQSDCTNNDFKHVSIRHFSSPSAERAE
jgi:hypothetical protein